MQNKDIKKIKSAPNNKYLLLVIVGFFLLIASIFAITITNNQKFVITDSVKFSAEVVETEESRQKGLSGRKSLEWQHAMVFKYDKEDYWNIWMKDMNFPIDVIWIDKNGRIVSIVKNIQPSSYPKTFGPKEKALTVIELPAGSVEHFKISASSTVNLEP